MKPIAAIVTALLLLAGATAHAELLQLRARDWEWLDRPIRFAPITADQEPHLRKVWREQSLIWAACSEDDRLLVVHSVGWCRYYGAPLLVQMFLKDTDGRLVAYWETHPRDSIEIEGFLTALNELGPRNVFAGPPIFVGASRLP